MSKTGLSPSSSELSLLASAQGAYAFYRWRNVAINLWASQPTGRPVEVLAQLTERSLSECPSGLASIHWLKEGVGLPSAEARLGLSSIARHYDKHLICVAVLLQGGGFWASAIRSALSGVVLLAPRTYPLRFFGEPDQLAGFVAAELRQRTAEDVEPRRLTHAIDAAVTHFSAADVSTR